MRNIYKLKLNNAIRHILHASLSVLVMATLLYSLGACTVSNNDVQLPSNTLSSATSISSLGVDINYDISSNNSTARVLEGEQEAENVPKGEAITVVINGKKRTAKFAQEITNDFEDDSDDLYQFYRFYDVVEPSSSEEIQLGISLLIDSKEDILVEAFVQIDFLNKETNTYEGGFYILDNNGVEEVAVDFDTYTFDFQYSGKGVLKNVHDNAKDFLPTQLDDIVLSVEGRREG